MIDCAGCAQHPVYLGYGDAPEALQRIVGSRFNPEQWQQTTSHFSRDLDAVRRGFGGDSPELAAAFRKLAKLHYEAGAYPDAERFFRSALDLDQKGRDQAVVAADFTDLALLLWTTGKSDEAEQLLSRALAIREALLGPDHPDTAATLTIFALLCKTRGRYPEAEQFARRGLAIREKALGPESVETANSLNTLALIPEVLGRYSEAEALYRRALAIYEKALGPEAPNTAEVLNNLALLLKTTGRFVEAESLYRRALAIREKVLGKEHPDTATSLNNLGLLYRATGRFSEAEPLYLLALAIREKILGPWHAYTATSLNNLAFLYLTTGRYGEAETLFRRALAVRVKALGPEHVDTANSFNNLALIYRAQGRYAEAEPLYQKAVEIREKKLGPNHADTAISLNNLGYLYWCTGRFQEAEPLYRRALEIDEKALGEDHIDTATSLNNLAALCRSTGRYVESESLYRRALVVAVNRSDPDLLRKIQQGYSLLLEKQNKIAAAIFFGKQAVNTIQTMRQNIALLGKDTLGSFTQTVVETYKNLTNLLISQGRLAEAQQVLAMLKEEEYFQYIRRDASDSGKLGTKSGFTAVEEPWLLEYERLSANNAKLGTKLGELRAKEQSEGLLDDERLRLNELLREEAAASEVFSSFVTRLVHSLHEEAEKLAKLSQVERDKRLAELSVKNLAGSGAIMQTLAELGEGAVLLHYLVMDNKVCIILTTPDLQLARHSEIHVKDLNLKISNFRDALANPGIDPRPLANELYRLLISPIEKELKEVKALTLMLSLDGTLRYIPFAALYDGKEYLITKYRTVIYAEVAKDKLALPAKPKWKVGALGVSDRVSDVFPALPSVAEELSGIVRVGKKGVVPGEIHLNGTFTERTLQESASRNSVIHIASHFKFSPETEKDSFLLLGDGSSLPLDRVRKQPYFRSAELLTLSACETAMGNSGTGSEIEGFGAIAMERGAKAVIATLWSVADESTSLLMREFYKLHEEKKLTKAEALRQAQLAILTGDVTIAPDSVQRTVLRLGHELPKIPDGEKPFTRDPVRPYAHPYFWAPFVLMGNWK